jgi:hypothetical protein
MTRREIKYQHHQLFLCYRNGKQKIEPVDFDIEVQSTSK